MDLADFRNIGDYCPALLGILLRKESHFNEYTIEYYRFFNYTRRTL